MNWSRLGIVGARVAWVGAVLCFMSCGSASLRSPDAAAGGSSGGGGSKSVGGAAGTSSGGAGGTSTGGAGGTGGTQPTGGTGGNRDGGVSQDGPSLAANGMTCSAGGTCTSGICVDGVCCNQDCSGQCESCKETGNLGKCLIVSGTPRNGRTACGGTSPCQASCDGNNGAACTFPGNSVQCVAASCAGGNATSATTCNGAGACTTPTTSPCSSNQCADGTKCSGGCSSSLPCGTGQYCDTTGACLPLKAAGAQCTSSSQCTSTFCVDNVCCGGACSGQCQGCNEGTPGVCVTVKGAPRGSRQACTGNDATCGGTCDGTSATQCTYPGPSTVCGQPGCTGSTAISPALCDSNGGCTTPTTTSCGAGTYCNATAGSCANQVATGGTCQTDVQCASGHCCGGICATIVGSDNANCGACGATCIGSCQSGSCAWADGQPCPNGKCLNKGCEAFWVDMDGDGFGTGSPTNFCGAPTQSGWGNRGGNDCCDSNGAVQPGMSDYMANPATPFPCGTMVSPWDYNCDGVIETGFAGTNGPDQDVSCGPAPACTGTPVNFPSSLCGTNSPSMNCTCSYNGSACTHACTEPFGAPSIGCL
jgi:hypothetical protein